MKIKFGTPITEFDGLPVHAWVTDASGQAPVRKIDDKTYIEIAQKPLTIGGEVCKALVAVDERDKAKMLQYGHLAQRIYGKDVVEISIEEAALIQDACAKCCTIWAYTQIHDLIESGTVKDTEATMKKDVKK